MGVLTLNNRVAKIRQKMAENNIDALLVTHRPNVYYLSGFTGTSGFLFNFRGGPTLYRFSLYTAGRASTRIRGCVSSTADFRLRYAYFPKD